MTSLWLQSLNVRLAGIEVLRRIDLHVDSGASLAILGRSGSGKTTLLRTIVGLEQPSGGRVIVGGFDLTDVPTAERGIALVTQQPSLDPKASLATNVERPLKLRGDNPPRSRQRRAVLELGRFGLRSRANARAEETSAGEQQTAATARGTVRQPGLLLLDEPVTAIDPDARRLMVRRLKQQQMANETTVIIATNDWEVAAGLADQIGVLANGTIIQLGSAVDLYDYPASIEVAELTGRWQLNLLPARLRLVPGERSELVTGAGPIRTWRDIGGGPMTVGLRPSDLTITDHGDLR
ncbi:MAG: ABC transporter ATP-binding protein, partial [Acidimicrobiia bacterium]|nr:ABC transporter ATP-binding protein [Acidimicrobiia bacterium]